MNSRRLFITAVILVFGLLSLAAAVWLRDSNPRRQKADFDGRRALRAVEHQVSLGPRTPGSQAHRQVVDWIADELEDAGWSVEVQESVAMGHRIRNIVGSRGEGDPWIIIGAHYDSRFFADEDPDPALQSQPVSGANDGASGVAVLLELARTLPKGMQKEIWLVFFDAEDNGNIPGWDWILGSSAFVEQLDDQPDYAVIVDMIGDEDLNIYLERNSDPNLSLEIWDQAAELGYSDYFIPQYKYRIIDDHMPFIQAGIPAVDIIDFDYPYWHTTEDTIDKVSAQSLEIVGKTLLAWLDADR